MRSEICRMWDRNYLRLPTADFELQLSLHPMQVSTVALSCHLVVSSPRPAGECTEVTQCAGSVRACAARGSEARGEALRQLPADAV